MIQHELRTGLPGIGAPSGAGCPIPPRFAQLPRRRGASMSMRAGEASDASATSPQRGLHTDATRRSLGGDASLKPLIARSGPYSSRFANGLKAIRSSLANRSIAPAREIPRTSTSIPITTTCRTSTRSNIVAVPTTAGTAVRATAG